MSGAYPISPLPMSINLGSEWATLQDMTQSGRRNVRQLGTQKWVFSLQYPSTLSRNQFMPIMGFLMEQEGRFETFTYTPEDLKTPRGAAAGTPLVNGISQAGSSLITDGWTNNILQVKIGDVFKLAGTKVYMITQNGTSDGSGNLTINFKPPLVESPADDEALVVTSVPFTVQLRDDNIKYSASGPLHYQQNVDMIEVL